MVAITATGCSFTTYDIGTTIPDLAIISKLTQSIIKFGHENITIIFNDEIPFLSNLFFIITGIVVIAIVKMNILNGILQNLTRDFLDLCARIITCSSALEIALFSKSGCAQNK